MGERCRRISNEKQRQGTNITKAYKICNAKDMMRMMESKQKKNFFNLEDILGGKVKFFLRIILKFQFALNLLIVNGILIKML